MKLLKDRLTTLAPECRPWAMWIWNGRITSDELASQLRGFADKGFAGVAIRPGRDMVPANLSEEFYLLLDSAMQIAESLKMGVRIADDFSLPWTGFFEPYAQQNSDLRAQKLVLVHTVQVGPTDTFELALDDADRFHVLGVQDAEGGKIDMSSVKILTPGGPKKNEISWKPGKGMWRAVVLKKQWVLGPAGNHVPNVYNSRVAQIYIQDVLQELLERYSKYIRTTLEGLITEMPAYVPSDNGIPWDDDLITRYRSKYKKEILQVLPALFFETNEAETKHRAHVHSFLAHSMYERFASALEGWAKKNRLSQWVLGPERDVASSNNMLRDGFAVPAVKLASAGIQNQEGTEDSYSLLRAVADMNTCEFGRETVVVIGRNRFGNASNLQSLKTEADLVALIGPARIVLDGCFFNLDHRNTIRTPYNPSWYSPDWEHLRALTDYMTRLQTTVRDLKRTTKVAVLMPTSSIMADYLPSRDEASRKGAQALAKVVHELQRHNVEYEIVSEQSLLASTVRTNGEFAAGAGTHRGTFSILMVPYARLVSKGLFVFLEKLSSKKGIVVLLDQAPEGNQDDGITASFTTRVEKFLRNRRDTVHIVASKDVGAYLAGVEPSVRVTVSGKRYPDVWVARGSAKDHDLYVLHNSADKRDCYATVQFPSARSFYIVDCCDGSMQEVKNAEKKDGGSAISLNFAPRQTYVVVSSSTKVTATDTKKKVKAAKAVPQVVTRNYRIILKDQWSFVPDSLNILPLAAWNTRIGLSRESGGFSHYCESYFEVRELPEICLLTMAGGMQVEQSDTGDATVEVFVNGNQVEMYQTEIAQPGEEAITPPSWETFLGRSTAKYDIKDLLIRGFNRVSVRTVGLFSHPPTVLYPLLVAGSFSIGRGAKGWNIDVPKAVVGYDSWTRHGFPYLSGCGVYTQGFEVPTEYKRIMLRFSRTSGGIDVAVNDKPLGTYNWHPMEMDITKSCLARRNVLTVRVRNTLDNLLRMNARSSGLIGDAYLDIY